MSQRERERERVGGRGPEQQGREGTGSRRAERSASVRGTERSDRVEETEKAEEREGVKSILNNPGWSAVFLHCSGLYSFVHSLFLTSKHTLVVSFTCTILYSHTKEHNKPRNTTQLMGKSSCLFWAYCCMFGWCVDENVSFSWFVLVCFLRIP